MGLLDSLLNQPQQQQDFHNYVQRYQQGAPHEGYTDQEVVQRYQQVAPQLAPQDYQLAAEQAFSRMSPQERTQFAQYVQQQAQTQGVPAAGFGQGVGPEAYQDPRYLAQRTAELHQQQPGLLSLLLGGGTGGGMPGSPVAKAAMAGIAAMAISNAMGGAAGGNPLGGILGGALGSALGGGQAQGGNLI